MNMDKTKSKDQPFIGLIIAGLFFVLCALISYHSYVAGYRESSLRGLGGEDLCFSTPKVNGDRFYYEVGGEEIRFVTDCNYHNPQE